MAFLNGVRVAILCSAALALLAAGFAAVAIPGKARPPEPDLDSRRLADTWKEPEWPESR